MIVHTLATHLECGLQLRLLSLNNKLLCLVKVHCQANTVFLWLLEFEGIKDDNLCTSLSTMFRWNTNIVDCILKHTVPLPARVCGYFSPYSYSSWCMVPSIHLHLWYLPSLHIKSPPSLHISSPVIHIMIPSIPRQFLWYSLSCRHISNGPFHPFTLLLVQWQFLWSSFILHTYIPWSLPSLHIASSPVTRPPSMKLYARTYVRRPKICALRWKSNARTKKEFLSDRRSYSASTSSEFWFFFLKSPPFVSGTQFSYIFPQHCLKFSWEQNGTSPCRNLVTFCRAKLQIPWLINKRAIFAHLWGDLVA